jgi:heterodisulfide reductase subunit C
MDALKQIAARDDLADYKESVQFYKSFIRSVRRHGRVNEMEFMTLYFAALKNPILPLRYAPLGMKLVRKGKVSMRLSFKQQRPLESIFRKVEALEKIP